MCVVCLRLSGKAASITAMRGALRGLAGVDRVEELSVDMPFADVDSSSAGMPDDEGGDTSVVEVHAVDDAAAENVRDRTEILARDVDVVIEWIDPF
jgi:hypothetical protein